MGIRQGVPHKHDPSLSMKLMRENIDNAVGYRYEYEYGQITGSFLINFPPFSVIDQNRHLSFTIFLEGLFRIILRRTEEMDSHAIIGNMTKLNTEFSTENSKNMKIIERIMAQKQTEVDGLKDDMREKDRVYLTCKLELRVVKEKYVTVKSQADLDRNELARVRKELNEKTQMLKKLEHSDSDREAMFGKLQEVRVENRSIQFLLDTSLVVRSDLKKQVDQNNNKNKDLIDQIAKLQTSVESLEANLESSKSSLNQSRLQNRSIDRKMEEKSKLYETSLDEMKECKNKLEVSRKREETSNQELRAFSEEKDRQYQEWHDCLEEMTSSLTKMTLCVEEKDEEIENLSYQIERLTSSNQKSTLEMIRKNSSEALFLQKYTQQRKKYLQVEADLASLVVQFNRLTASLPIMLADREPKRCSVIQEINYASVVNCIDIASNIHPSIKAESGHVTEALRH